MKLAEVDTLNLNSQIVVPFCISWSQDNQILIVAEGGVFIYELSPTPLSSQPTVTFIKSWIPASTTQPLSNAIFNDRVSPSFLWSLDRKEAYEVVLDSTLSYSQKFNFATTSYIIQCEFSPLINSKSFISCLNNHGQVDIYEKHQNKWVPIIDVTNLWMFHCNVKSNVFEINFEYFKVKMLELKIRGIKWGVNPDPVFFTLHENGGITMWNVEMHANILEINVHKNIVIEGKPACLEFKWNLFENLKSLVLVGALSGVVKGLVLNQLTGEVIKSFDLWNHEDSIPPALIKIKVINKKVFLFVVKRHILLIHDLLFDETNNKEQVETKWHEFPSSIISFNEFEDSVLITLQNHDTYLLNVKNIDKIDLESVDLGVKPKHKASHHCYGLTMSKNKAIWMLISSPKINYDSLPKLTHLFMYTPEIKKYKSLTDNCCAGLLDKVLKELPCAKLNEVFDFLELKKIELLFDNSKFKEFSGINKDYLLIELQMMLWEEKLKFFCNLAEFDSAVGEIEISIAKTQAKKFVSKFESKSKSTLTDVEIKSLDICKALLKEKKGDKEEAFFEVCSICGAPSFLEDVRVSSCANGHQFPRCCLSLLPCDAFPYAVCQICESVALLYFVTEEDDRCPYCDGYLEIDSRLRMAH